MYFPTPEHEVVADLLSTGSHYEIHLDILTYNPAKPKRWYRKQAVPAHYWVSLTIGDLPFVEHYEARAATPKKAVIAAVRAIFGKDTEPNLL